LEPIVIVLCDLVVSGVLGYFDDLEQDAVLNQALQTTFKKSR